MTRFNYQLDYDLGRLTNRVTPQQNTYLQENVLENDVYKFDINGTFGINLHLNILSYEDDADLELYRDSNNNGILDDSDSLVVSSNNTPDSTGFHTDFINHQTFGDTYFARVNYYDGGSDEKLDYSLDLSVVTSTTPISRTGNTYLDGILWDGERLSSNTITYSFWGNGSESFDDNAYNITDNAYDWLNSEIEALEEALETWETVANIDFVRVADNDPNATFGFYSVDEAEFDALGMFNPPGENGQGIGYFNWQGKGWDISDLQQGDYGFLTILHEIGHGLGLAHPHDTGGGDSLVYPGVINSHDHGEHGLNQGMWTTMSYNDGLAGSNPDSDDYGWQGTPMSLDIAAIQHLYGANLDYATGDDIYQLATSNAPGSFYAAIWDVDGTDTISADTATADVTIDLREAPLSGTDAGGFISSVADISAGFTIANGITIENAIGGESNDSITGNDADNNLIGNEGNDTMSGGKGNDILTGSNPDFYDSGSGEYDVLTGGAGADIFILGDSYEAYYQDFSFATITDFDVYEGDTIQVFGTASDYSLQEDTYNDGIDILYQGDLIGFISNTTTVAIDKGFTFVS